MRLPSSEPIRGGETPSTPDVTKLRGGLGTPAVVLMVVAASAPLTTLGASLPVMISVGEGVAAPVAFIIAGAVFLFFAIGFVSMTNYVSSTGAFYAYVEKGLGPRAGVGAAFVAWSAYTATMLAVYAYLGSTTASLVENIIGATPPWWLMTAIVIVIIGLVGYRHIELSAKVLSVFLVSEMVIVLLLDAAIVFRGGTVGITGDSFTPEGISPGLGVALLFALFGFVGVEATAIFREETNNPKATVKRATYWAVGLVAVFYSLSSWLIIEGNGGSAAVGAATEDPDNFMVSTAGTYLGVVARDTTQVLLVVSLFAAALAFHNIAARYVFVLGKRGLIPRRLGRSHPRHGSPAAASITLTVISAATSLIFVLLQLDPLLQVYSPVGGVGITGLAFLWLLTSASVAVYFARIGNSAGTVTIAIISVVMLGGAVAFILFNLPLIVGGSVGLAIAMGTIPFVFFLFGFLLNRRATGELAG